MSEYLNSVKNGFSFLEPAFLYLLIPIGILFLLWLAFVLVRMRSRPAMTYGSKYPLIGKSKLWGFFLVAEMLVVMALAKPYLPKGGVSISRGDIEVILVIDRSISTRANDVGESRLEISKREAFGIEPLLVEGDKIALFVFGRESHRKIYLTKRHDTVFERVGNIAFPKRLRDDGLVWDSDFASMLENIYQSLDRQDAYNDGYTGNKYVPQKRSNRIVVLMSDGEDQFKRDNPTTATEAQYKKNYLIRLNKALNEFKRRGLKIYPVGVGTRKGVSWPSLLKGYKEKDDYPEGMLKYWIGRVSRLDRDNLEFLARSTGVDLSNYVWTIENPGTTAKNYLGSVISSNRKKIPDFGTNDDEEQLWQYFLMAAVLVILMGVVSYPFSGYFRRRAPKH